MSSYGQSPRWSLRGQRRCADSDAQVVSEVRPRHVPRGPQGPAILREVRVLGIESAARPESQSGQERVIPQGCTARVLTQRPDEWRAHTGQSHVFATGEAAKNTATGGSDGSRRTTSARSRRVHGTGRPSSRRPARPGSVGPSEARVPPPARARDHDGSQSSSPTAGPTSKGRSSAEVRGARSRSGLFGSIRCTW